jgi:hypothetical protein
LFDIVGQLEANGIVVVAGLLGNVTGVGPRVVVGAERRSPLRLGRGLKSGLVMGVSRTGLGSGE